VPGANTLLADRVASQIAMGCTTLVAHPNGWDQMAERQRVAENDGFCLGLDAANLAEASSAGNAVVTQVTEWVAKVLLTTS
jgi:DNA (cytosine-5)-methyltransferase 1